MKTNTKPPTNDYVTKQDLKQAMDEQTKSIASSIQEVLLSMGTKFDEQDKRFEQIDQKFKQVRKDISESSLMIIDELKTSREEQTILGYRQSEHANQFIELNNRVSILEKKLFSN